MRKITHICMLIAFIAVILIPCNKAFAASDTFLINNNVYNKSMRTSDSEPYLKRDYASILTGTSDTLKVYKVPDNSEVTYKSSDESILTVKAEKNNTCEYTGAGTGTATITIKIQQPLFLFVNNTYTLKFTVDVTPKAVSVKFRKDKYQLETGESKRLQYTIRPSISDEIPVFESSDNDIVSVTSKGKAYAKAKGTAYITATLANGNSDKCKIIVR